MDSLQIYKPTNATLNRLGRIFSKIPIKSKKHLNSINIHIKRNSMIKKYRRWMENEKYKDSFIKSFNQYVEAINDYMMNKVYKRVKIEIATEYEKNILSEYYYILKLKEECYDEYNYKKQRYLINLDYENIQDDAKEFEQFKDVYEYIINELYSKIMQLTENMDDNAKQKYILDTLAEYNNDKFVKYILIKNNIEQYEFNQIENEKETVESNIKKYQTILKIAEKVFPNVVTKEYISFIENKINIEKDLLKKMKTTIIKTYNKEIKNKKFIKVVGETNNEQKRKKQEF